MLLSLNAIHHEPASGKSVDQGRDPPRTAAIMQVSVESSCTENSSDIDFAVMSILVDCQVPRLPSLQDSDPLPVNLAPLVKKLPV